MNFIVFEGIDGCGKTTQSKKLVKYLNKLGLNVIYTREPGGSLLAEKLREIILNDVLDPEMELILMLIARIDHINNFIIPNLKKGNIVVCDRFTDSTIAYQKYGRGLKFDSVIVNELMIKTLEIKPDITFIMDISPESALSRVKDPNIFEKSGIDFYKRVRDAFIMLSKRPLHKLINCNSKSIDEVFDEVVENLV